MSILEKLGEGATKVFDTVAGFVAPVLAVGKGVLDLKTASKQRQAVEAQVEAAELDARSALTQTQAKAVQTKLAELQGQLDGSGAAQTEASP